MSEEPSARVRERVRYRVGWWLSGPFWGLHRLGDRALDVSTRLIMWAEKDRRDPEWSGGQSEEPSVQAKNSSELPEAIVRMVLEGDVRRSEEARIMFSHLTERERALVREAAVMGYVNGVMAERGHRESIPPDRSIVAEVLLCCRSNRDMYPNLGWLTATENASPSTGLEE